MIGHTSWTCILWYVTSRPSSHKNNSDAIIYRGIWWRHNKILGKTNIYIGYAKCLSMYHMIRQRIGSVLFQLTNASFHLRKIKKFNYLRHLQLTQIQCTWSFTTNSCLWYLNNPRSTAINVNTLRTLLCMWVCVFKITRILTLFGCSAPVVEWDQCHHLDSSGPIRQQLKVHNAFNSGTSTASAQQNNQTLLKHQQEII